MGHPGVLFRKPKRLGRYNAANQGVFGAVNDTHAATAQFAEDFIPAGFGGCFHLPSLFPRKDTQRLTLTFAPFSAAVNGPSELVFRSRHERTFDSPRKT